tara:strand:+ start:43449 stop:43985 length:537 start_codon:yes stop_codon:yes gene_type:complete
VESELDKDKLIEELKKKVVAAEEQEDQWLYTYNHILSHLSDIGKLLVVHGEYFKKLKKEKKKKEYAFLNLEPLIRTCGDMVETAILNSEESLKGNLPYLLTPKDSNELKVAVLLNELITSYDEHPRLSPKARLEKLLLSKRFHFEAEQRDIDIDVFKLSNEAQKRIITLVNTDKRNGL